MAYLLTANALLFIGLYVVWTKSDVLNAGIKIALLVLALANGFQSYQAFEVLQNEAKARNAK